MTAFEPIIPTELTAGQVEFINPLSKALLPTSFTLDNSSYQLNLSVVPNIPEGIKTVQLQLGATQLNAAISSSQLLSWLSDTLNVKIHANVPDLLIIALLEKSILPLQGPIHEYLGHTLSINERMPESGNNDTFYINVHIAVDNSETSITTLDLFLPCNQHREWLLETIKRLPLQERFNADQLPVIITPFIGFATLNMSDYRTLASGDIILFDHCLLTHNTVQLTTANKTIASACISGNSLNIHSMASIMMEEEPHTEIQDNEDNQVETLNPLENLPIRINFELGSITLPISDVKTLAPGQVFELEGLLDSPVQLTVNGKTIGRGELVKLGDKPGIRLLSLDSYGEQQ